MNSVHEHSYTNAHEYENRDFFSYNNSCWNRYIYTCICSEDKQRFVTVSYSLFLHFVGGGEAGAGDPCNTNGLYELNANCVSHFQRPMFVQPIL